MGTTTRVLDANINRAAEGMRVLEDIARFVLNQPDLCEAVKICRHNLRQLTPARESLLARDTPRDVGTAISTPSESTRTQLHDVAIAAGNRCAEALRVIEEVMKLDGEEVGAESIRYQMYDHAATVVQSLGARTKKQWKLCFILTVETCVLPWRETLQLVLGAGCDCVQVREKTMTTRELVEHTSEVLSFADSEGASVIVNDRVDVALVTEAHGVHLGSEDMTVRQARQQCGFDVLIGSTVHSVEEAKAATDCGADYLGVGPIFASTTKPELCASGSSVMQEILERFPSTNHLAIGGVSTSNVEQLYAIGCKGVAMCNSIASSTSPDQIVRDVLKDTLQPS